MIYVALAFGPVAGLLAGRWAGLVQDALAGGSSASAGSRRRSSGSSSGLLGAQFIVAQSLPRLVMFVGGTVVHELCYQALYALVETRVSDAWSAALTQAAINGIVGILAFFRWSIGPGPAGVAGRRCAGASTK